jgi:hypothetical protein
VTRDEFDTLVQEQQTLIRLVNDLEYQLYRVGDAAAAVGVDECRQSAGVLIGALRSFLYRLDQQVLPLLETGLACGDK